MVWVGPSPFVPQDTCEFYIAGRDSRVRSDLREMYWNPWVFRWRKISLSDYKLKAARTAKRQKKIAPGVIWERRHCLQVIRLGRSLYVPWSFSGVWGVDKQLLPCTFRVVLFSVFVKWSWHEITLMFRIWTWRITTRLYCGHERLRAVCYKVAMLALGRVHKTSDEFSPIKTRAHI